MNEMLNENVKLRIGVAIIFTSVIGFIVALSSNSLVRGVEYTSLLLIIMIPIIFITYQGKSANV